MKIHLLPPKCQHQHSQKKRPNLGPNIAFDAQDEFWTNEAGKYLRACSAAVLLVFILSRGEILAVSDARLTTPLRQYNR